MACAVRLLSPVKSNTLRPILCSVYTATDASGFTPSDIHTCPSNRPVEEGGKKEDRGKVREVRESEMERERERERKKVTCKCRGLKKERE